MIPVITQADPIMANVTGDRNAKIRGGHRVGPGGLAPAPVRVAPARSGGISTAFTSIVGGGRRGSPTGETPSGRFLSSGSAMGISASLTRRHTVCRAAAMQTPTLCLTDQREQHLLGRLACNLDYPSAGRHERCRSLG